MIYFGLSKMGKAMSRKDSLIFPGMKIDKDLLVLLEYYSLVFANYNLFASIIKFLPILFSSLILHFDIFSTCMLFFLSVRLEVHVSSFFSLPLLLLLFFYSVLMAMIFSLAAPSSLLSCGVACSTMVVVENASRRRAVAN